MTSLEAFVPAILSQLAWTVGLIFFAAVTLSAFETIKKIRRRWGSIGLKPRYAFAYLRRHQII